MSYTTDGLCHNAEPGSYGHECGKGATWIGSKSNGFQSGFCDRCREHGWEARQFTAWKPRTGPARYRPLLRPAGFATLPAALKWSYVEAPAMDGLANRPDLPRSRHRYGVIETDRTLSADEMKRFDLSAVAILTAEDM